MPGTIPALIENLKIIQQLGDNPGAEDNLTPQELKAKFDEAAEIIKTYINDVLVPFCNDYVAPEGTGYLRTIGGQMSGNIDMASNKVENLPTPAAKGDAANKDYVDIQNDKYLETGKQYASTLNSNLAAKIDASLLQKKVTLTVEGWSEAQEQTVEIEGVTATDLVLYSADPSDEAGRTAAIESDVFMMSQAEGSVTFKWGEAKPEVPVTFNVAIQQNVGG